MRQITRAEVLLWIQILALLALRPAAAATSTERVATGINRAVFATAPPGDQARLFVVEQQTGRIEILDLATGTNLGAFLTVGGLATGHNEQGLLGLAFDPDYATNGFFYVNFTASSDGRTIVRRYQVQGDPATSNVADDESDLDILSFSQPGRNHNGGWIGFSPHDGYLYIASGDGGGSNDSGSGHTPGIGNAQDTTDNLLGKMLRIDPSREDEPEELYTVPTGNPFVDKTGDDEIWAYGLRNPYRASFDRQTGDLWIGDVGQGAREEIDFQPADSLGEKNYGWRLREGTIATPSAGIGGPPPANNVEPVYDYEHGSGPFEGDAVIGGYVYRGPVDAFGGHYFFADNESHNIWKLDPHAIDIPLSVTRVNDDLAPDSGSIAFIGSFGEDAVGNLYIAEVFGGELFKIVTDSEDIVWNGDSAVGTPGDGNSWSDANNWTRGGNADQAFVAEDNVIFAAGSSQSTINLAGDRTVAAGTFEAAYTLTGDTLKILSGNVTVDDGVTATIESDLAAESTNHSVRKLGAGTLLVEGSAHQTAVLEGTLGGSGTLDHLTAHDGATVAPGASTGILTVAGSFTLEPDSTLDIELGGTDNSDPQNPEHDRIEIGGAASLGGGTLNVRLVDLGGGEFQPGAGDTFGILAANGGFDMFGETILPDLEPGLEWVENPGAVTFFLVVQIALPGDYNQDGMVTAADYTVWRDTLGETVVAGSHADGNGDGTINPADYEVWKTNYEQAAAQGAAVPEPAALVLLLLAAIAALGVVRGLPTCYF